MDDIRRAIETAWARVKHDLFTNHDELRKRLMRGLRPSLSRPPREWCVAFRATDTRIRMPLADPRPRSAVEKGREAPHQVRIDRDIIHALCAHVPVEGLTVDEAAAQLGTNPKNLHHARVRGVFGSKYIKGLGGFWGKPRPVLYAKERLDPGKRGFAEADAAWSYTGQPCLSEVPADFAQTLERVPCFIEPHGRHYRDTRDLHPEHPDVDTGVPRRSRRPVGPLPAPEPDAAWYKWKDGVYLGYDWRNPLAKANYEHFEQKRAKRRVYDKAYRREHLKSSRAGGSIQFRGWLWVCPRCKRRVRTLYWPLSRRNLAAGYPSDVAALKRAGVKHITPWPTAHWHFACAHCHRIVHFSSLVAGFWNNLVGQLTCGLLYGREVERPAWLTPQRKKSFAPGPNGRPPLRRLRIQELLLKGWSYAQIAADMKISPETVHVCAGKIYRQHNVHGRHALARRLGVDLTPPTTLVENIRSRVAAGMRYADIAAELSIARSTVTSHVVQLRNRGLLPPSKARAAQGTRHIAAKSKV